MEGNQCISQAICEMTAGKKAIAALPAAASSCAIAPSINKAGRCPKRRGTYNESPQPSAFLDSQFHHPAFLKHLISILKAVR
jgi:hypothetical protein